MHLPDPGIYLLTGPVHSGKTTSLLSWAKGRQDVYGILSPVIRGKRMFMDAHTGEQFPMEASEGETETLLVGRFVFSKTRFDKAIGIIRDARERAGWLIIDEIGPLELREEGFYSVLQEVLKGRKDKLILVVRDHDKMPERVRSHFNLKNVHCISSPGDL